MPYKIGVDFGTTNSTVAFVNDAHTLEAFRYPGPAGNEYIPSCVAYEKDGSIALGRGALALAGDPDVIFCDNFKMILPLSDSERTKYNWTGKNSPETVVADYFRHLLSDIDENSFVHQKGKIDGIVLSVPHVWAKAMNHPGRSRLQTIITHAGLPLIQLISEPVAAAAYYAYKFQQEKSTSFQGNLLVCDMGGGTFDVTLCKITPGKVEELYNDGNGSTGLGKAGVFFDRKLLLDSKPSIEENSPDFYRLYNALQTDKTDRHVKITKNIISAMEEPEYRPKLSILKCGNERSFNYEDVSSAFREVKEGIDTVLKRFRLAIKERDYAVDAVFFVGGFAQFYLVREAIKEFWGLRKGDPRFIEEVNNEISRYAIAYGATLVANNMIAIEEKYEHTIGVEVFRLAKRSDSKVYEQKLVLMPIIKGGKKLSEYEAVQFAEDFVKAYRAMPDVTIYVDESSKDHPVIKKLPETLAIKLPNIDLPGNQWRIGMRINKSKVVYMVFQDQVRGESAEYELGDLLRQMFGGLWIQGEV
jgi:molecular chaperone DnaK